ncbi:autotransporter outer membrane beta-barrel domain-containing protein, partial [Saonia flava]
MKLKFLIVFLSIFCLVSVRGQIKIGDNPQNINASSVLELESTTRAFVVTRVNTAQMNAIVPLQGALVYNTDNLCLHYYDGAQWINLCGGDELNTTNVSLALEGGNLVLTDSDNNAVSVPLEEISAHTYTTDPIQNSIETIVITQNGDSYNFEVGEITGNNIVNGSINGFLDIQAGSISDLQLQANSVGQEELQDNTVADLEIDYDQVTLADFTNDAGYVTAGDIISTEPGNVLTDDNGAFYDDSGLLTDIAANAGNIQANADGLAAHILADEDTDANNELITGAAIVGNELIITEKGIETSVNLGVFNNTGSDNQNLESATLLGSDLTINIEGGNPAIADLSALATDTELAVAIADSEALDNDKEDDNELITSAVLTGTDLIITEAGTATPWTVPLASLSGSNGADGSIIDPTGGTNINITGAGTSGDPYIINSTFTEVDGSITNEIQTLTSDGSVNITPTGPNNTDYILTVPGSETIVNPGTNITITGNGTTATPYIINASGGIVADGSETVINSSSTVTVSGMGTSGNPYVLTSVDTSNGSETIINQGANITITGDGTVGNPYIINASGTIGTDWTDLAGIPTGFADDTDNDTQYIAGTGLTLSAGNEFALDAATIVADWANLTGIPA